MSTPTQHIYWNTIAADIVNIAEGQSVQQVIVLDKNMEETTLTFSLDGMRAHLDCVIVILADEVSIPLNINVIAHARNTSSSVRIRSIGRNRARVMINGILQCMEGADESTMHFSHHALHLSPDAQTRTIPSLEIKADDVQAKHEVSIGYFDPHAIWYGQTRGVSKETMIAEMAKGFVAKDLQTLSDDRDISTALASVTAFMRHA
ncbi:MAG: SufD family Fe-S cluster assembly protein [Patescibacteria group bacterium]